jgi:hypothetical protein
MSKMKTKKKTKKDEDVVLSLRVSAAAREIIDGWEHGSRGKRVSELIEGTVDPEKAKTAALREQLERSKKGAA